MNFKIATVAVDNTFFSFDTDYDYILPNEFEAYVGSRVNVPFGKGNTVRSGIIISIKQDDNNNTQLKSIVEVLDRPLSDEMVSLALWMKERCFCTTYDCLKQMLPRSYGKIGSKTLKMVRLAENDIDFSSLTKKQRNVCELLADIGAAGVNEICEFCSVGIGVLNTLKKHNVVEFYNK